MKRSPLLLLITLLSCSLMAKEYAPLSTQTLDSQPVKSKGKVTYLKFWATWCSYCIEEMPLLERTYEQANGGYQVIAVNIGFNQSERGVRAFLNKHQYQFPTVFDASGEITQQFKVLGTPQHILIDEHGQEIYRSALFTDELKTLLETYQGGN
ncbi:TlpA disulfide reductase family protein [Pseudoalteromonas xiamenensis]